MTPLQYKKYRDLSYSELGNLFGCSKARAFNICKNKGPLRVPEINRIVNASDGCIQHKDLGLEVI